MQLMLILGIAFAIGAVLFALQNTALVVVTLALWSVEGSLAVVLLLAVGVGVLITALLTTPTVIRAQWAAKRLRRQVADLERQLTAAAQREQALAAREAAAAPVPDADGSAEPDKNYVGLRTLLASGEAPPPADR